jgi:hypothetical protein
VYELSNQDRLGETIPRGGAVQHIINGCRVDLEALSDEALEITLQAARRCVQRGERDERLILDEAVRRADNVIPLFKMSATGEVINISE